MAKATEKGRPRNISSGNCRSPAPPPDKEAKVLAIKEPKNRASEFIQSIESSYLLASDNKKGLHAPFSIGFPFHGIQLFINSK
ncbi:hypothetical protein VCR31J2_1360376 [Vibrio coralliirubri]|uniref:Uncharacterized protein n=1 Tax=Vibrio coralliirubri TaxID=1516159 RepID=A0AA86XT32_9VIBR|nr:hypothetical protein VCR31J2_1360376 [Vibrio coralliirubri]